MTTREEWLALAERCEKPTWSNWEMERDILFALGYSFVGAGGLEMPWCSEDGEFWFKGDITNSLDSITALIERELPGWELSSGIQLSGDGGGGLRRYARGFMNDSQSARNTSSHAATEPLARCAAFCRAMAGKEDKK